MPSELSPVSAGTAAEAATSAEAWLRAFMDAEVALATAQARLGLIPAETPRIVASTPVADDLAVRARLAGNPVVPLAADLRAATEYAHYGATSQDIMDTAMMLVAARVRSALLDDLHTICIALAGLARRHRDTPMAARTLMQQAVPTTFGLVAAGWLTATAHASDALRGLELPAQLGGAAGTTVTGDLLAAFAAETGLAEPVLPWHVSRAPVIRLGAALGLVAGALGKMATDVVLLAQTEIGEVAEPAAPGRGGSSSMPHKRNPVLATMIRSAALRLPGLVQTLFAAQLAPGQRPAGEWHAEWEPLNDALRLTGAAAETAAELTHGLQVFPDRMLANMSVGGDTGHAGELVDRALAAYEAR